MNFFLFLNTLCCGADFYFLFIEFTINFFKYVVLIHLNSDLFQLLFHFSDVLQVSMQVLLFLIYWFIYWIILNTQVGNLLRSRSLLVWCIFCQGNSWLNVINWDLFLWLFFIRNYSKGFHISILQYTWCLWSMFGRSFKFCFLIIDL